MIGCILELADKIEDEARAHDQQRGSCPADLHDALRQVNALRTAVAVHPHDDLVLKHCAILDARRRRWQELWDATPIEGDDCPADAALKVYSETVWPCPQEPLDVLTAMRAVSPEAVRAKAAAALAINEAGSYGYEAFDDMPLMLSALRDAAGPTAWRVGKGASDA